MERFETDDTTIELEKVAAFESVETDEGLAVHVELNSGLTVKLEGDEEVESFVEAVDEFLESA